MLAFSLIMTAIMSLTMIGFGFLFVKKPPKEINSVLGYRTPMSTKNKDTWNFAHSYSGKVWIRSGIIITTISLVIIFSLQGFKNYSQIMLMLFYVQIATLLLVIPLTESALRRTFDKNGIRKAKNPAED
jgi:uncharacterized membrane protein